MTPEAALKTPIQALRIMLGMLFVAQFWDNVHYHRLGEVGYRKLIDGYVAHSDSPGVWKDVMRFVADHGAIAAPLQGATEAALAVALLVGVAVPLAAAVSGGLLTTLWLSELGLYWSWELPPLILCSALVVIAALPDLRARPDAGGLLTGVALPGRIALAVLGGATIAGMLAANGQPDDIVWRAGVTAALLLAGGALTAARA